jgi:sugar phosphate isomerase/epimerase
VSAVRLAGHTYPYRDRPLGDALDALAAIRLSSVEIWLGHAGKGPEAVGRLLHERGLEAAAVSAGGFYAADSEVVPRSFGLAEALGAPVVVACVTPTVLETVLDRVPAGVTLCVENHWDQALATSRELNVVLTRYPQITACLDTGHALLAGEAPERAVAMLGPRVGHVHLKDAAFPSLRARLMGRRLRRRFMQRPEPVTPGAGALDVARFRRALEAAGFEGTVTVEHEGSEPSVALELLLEAWAPSGEALVRAS